MTEQLKQIQGKVAIVTGAGRMRGIGRAIALRLAGDGANVAVTAVAHPPESFPEHERAAGWLGAESVAKEVRALGRRSLALDVDVTKPEQVQAMVQRTLDEFGRIDILSWSTMPVLPSSLARRTSGKSMMTSGTAR